MAKFEIGDKVHMPEEPSWVVEVLEIGDCVYSDCPGETFRFIDPETGGDDWMHTSEFERI